MLLACVLGLSACGQQQTNKEENVLLRNVNIDDVEKVTIKSGGTGESVDITEPEDIEYITNSINSLEYSKGEKVNGDGWSYMLRWYNSDGEIAEEITLLGTDTIIFDGHYYRNISDKEIDISFLVEQFTEDSTNISESSEEPAISVSFVYIAGKEAEQSKIDLQPSDANTVISVFDGANWAPSATKCFDDYEVWIGDELFYYHSECGTINDRINDQSFSLTDTQREDMNEILVEQFGAAVDQTQMCGYPRKPQ